MKSAVSKLQEELTQQKLITQTISEENIKTKQQLEKLQPLVEFVNSFDMPQNLKTILDFIKDDYAEEKLRPLKVEFSPYISKKLEEIAKTEGITRKDAIEKFFKDNLETIEKAEAKFKKLEEHSKRRR